MGDKDQKLKDYETGVRHRVECEERAFHIVNKLLDGKVPDQYLIECGQRMSREHYSDVVEERAISFVCGYPLCDNQLTNVPKQKYHISTKTNKVYDISERKNFCSNKCLKASKHFCHQIPSSPVWMREREGPADIQLLQHKSTRGIVGDEVIGIPPTKVLEEEIKTLNLLDSKTSSSDNRPSPSKASSGETSQASMKKSRPAVLSKSRYAGRKDATTVDSKPRCHNAGVESNNKLESDEKDSQSQHQSQSVEPTSQVVKERDIIGDHVTGSDNSERLSQQNEIEKSLSREIQKLTVTDSIAESTEGRSGTKVNTCGRELVKNNDTKVSKESESEANSRSKSAQNTYQTQDKMEQLKMLLTKRKNVLLKLADVQQVVPDSKMGKTAEPEQLISETLDSEKKGNEDKVNCSSDTKDSAHICENLTVSAHTSGVEGEEGKIMAVSDNKELSSSQSDSPSTTAASAKSSKGQKAPKKGGRVSSSSISPMEGISEILKTWITKETSAYLQASSWNADNESPQSFSDPRVQRNYADLCKRLDFQQKEYEDMTSGLEGAAGGGKKPLKAAPDYSGLKKEAEEFQLKVTEFITGKKQIKQTSKKDDKEDDDVLLLPSVDTYDQKQIRIKIVLERLEKSLPGLLTPLCLNLQDVSTLLRELVHSFRLEKDTIVFKPSEWTLVAMFLLKMLSYKSRDINEAFAKDSARRYFAVVLQGIGHSATDLDSLTDYILKLQENEQL